MNILNLLTLKCLILQAQTPNQSQVILSDDTSYVNSLLKAVWISVVVILLVIVIAIFIIKYVKRNKKS